MAVPVAAAFSAATPKTFAGIPVASIAAGAQVAGAALAATGLVSSGITARRQGEFEKAVLEQQAESERQAAAAREDDFRRQQSRQMAARRALLGATGVEPTEGSPLMVSEDLAGEVELQALRIRHGGDVVSRRLEQQARLQAFSGRATQRTQFLRGGALLFSEAGRNFGGRAVRLPESEEFFV